MAVGTQKGEKTKTWISGFCNATNPADSHMRCKGSYNGTPCACPHHQTTGEVTTVAERYLTPPHKPKRTYSIAVMVEDEPEAEPVLITVEAGNLSAALSLAAAEAVAL